MRSPLTSQELAKLLREVRKRLWLDFVKIDPAALLALAEEVEQSRLKEVRCAEARRADENDTRSVRRDLLR